jgi:hypothetical protein
VITTRDVWRRGFFILRSTAATTAQMILLGMLLPELVFIFAFDLKAEGPAAALRQLGAQTSGGFEETLLISYSYLASYVWVALLLWMLFLGTYLGLVHLAVHYERSGESLTAWEGLRRGLRSALRGGLGLSLFVLAVGFFGQTLTVPAALLGTLGLAIPVLMVAEKSGVWRALRDAVGLRYLRNRRAAKGALSGWNVSFMLLVQGSFFYACISLIALGAEALLHLDRHLGLPRAAWTYVFAGHDFGPLYAAVTVLESTLSSALLGLLPATTTAIYFLVAGRREIGRA